MLGQDLIVAPTQSRPPALIEGSGRKARDRIEHFLRAAIDNDNTRRAYGRSLGSFFAFLEDGGKERVQDIGPLDVRDYQVDRWVALKSVVDLADWSYGGASPRLANRRMAITARISTSRLLLPLPTIESCASPNPTAT